MMSRLAWLCAVLKGILLGLRWYLTAPPADEAWAS